MLRVHSAITLVLMLAGCATQPVGSPDASPNTDAQQALRQDLKTHYDQGEALYKAGQLEQARVQFRAMLDLKPEEPNANYRLGTIAFKQGLFEESATHFEAVVEVDPKNFKAHYNLAAIRLMQAENHFKYYAALVEPDTDLGKVSKLMADIDDFNNKRKPKVTETSLEQLATSLKK